MYISDFQYAYQKSQTIDKEKRSLKRIYQQNIFSLHELIELYSESYIMCFYGDTRREKKGLWILADTDVDRLTGGVCDHQFL